MNFSLEDFRSQTGTMVQLLIRLAEIESPSTEKAAVDRLGEALQGELLALGASVQIEPRREVGDVLIGRWNPQPGQNGILLLAHIDTVFASGTLEHWPVRVEGKRILGPGVMDMKGGIVVALSAVQWLRTHQQMPARPITILFTTDEETGSGASRGIIEELARQAELVLCLEPALPNGAVKTARKGTGNIEIVARGKAAHAGADHALGRNAIEELAHHILAAQRQTNYERGTTLNVGIVQGGTRSNVVPDEARAEVDFRVVVPEEIRRIEEWAASLRPVLEGTQVSASVKLNRPPLPRDERMAATFAKAQRIGASLGLNLFEGSTGGASDANFVAPLGVAVLDGLGPVGDGEHSEREHVLIPTLPERAALLAALFSDW